MLQPQSLEQSWEMKPCLSVIVTEGKLTYFPEILSSPLPPLTPLSPLPLALCYIVLQDQVHGGRGWRRVMGPLSLCLRAG